MKTRAIKTAAIAIIASVFLTGEVVAEEPEHATFFVNFYLGTVHGFPDYFKLKHNTIFRGKNYEGMVFPNGLGTLPRVGHIEKVLIEWRFLQKYSSSKIAVAPDGIFKFAEHKVLNKNRVALIFEFHDARRTYSTVFFVKFDAKLLDVSYQTYIGFLVEHISGEYYVCARDRPPLNCLDITP